MTSIERKTARLIYSDDPKRLTEHHKTNKHAYDGVHTRAHKLKSTRARTSSRARTLLLRRKFLPRTFRLGHSVAGLEMQCARSWWFVLGAVMATSIQALWRVGGQVVERRRARPCACFFCRCRRQRRPPPGRVDGRVEVHPHADKAIEGKFWPLFEASRILSDRLWCLQSTIVQSAREWSHGQY